MENTAVNASTVRITRTQKSRNSVWFVVCLVSCDQNRTKPYVSTFNYISPRPYHTVTTPGEEQLRRISKWGCSCTCIIAVLHPRREQVPVGWQRVSSAVGASDWSRTARPTDSHSLSTSREAPTPHGRIACPRPVLSIRSTPGFDAQVTSGNGPQHE